MRAFWRSAALLAWAGMAWSQTLPDVAAAPSSKPIQDNSFLIEEAYNQEAGVVQHINLLRSNWHTGEWSATFTQEWPIGGVSNQLSYTIPYQRLDAETGTFTGLGDVLLNYRYQLVGNGEARVAVAPRLTLSLPTGNAQKGLGRGSASVQAAIPVSVVLGPDWVAHGNVGATWTPSQEDTRGDRAVVFGEYVGGSVIWLGGGHVNGMLEIIWSNDPVAVGPGRTQGEPSFFVSPGVRWAYDFPSGLQIVPGIGVPIGVGPSRGQYGVLLYLSFEHPFRTVAAR